MKYQVWLGDSNDRNCVAQLEVRSLNQLINHVLDAYAVPRNDVEESGNEDCLILDIQPRCRDCEVKLNPQHYGYESIEEMESLCCYECPYRLYIQLEKVEEFASFHPKPRELES